jgi:hypothetical protein
VSLSSDGNTAIVGSLTDNSVGAAWVYTRSDGVWSQQAKLVGAGGQSVSLSGDGNTAIVGQADNNNGAVGTWVYTRSGGGCGPSNSSSQSKTFLSRFPATGTRPSSVTL